MNTSIEAIAAAQDGLVTAAQCRAAGLRAYAVAGLVRRGMWQAVFRGVYATDDGPLTARRRIRAGLLSVGPGAVAVLTSAGVVHGWPVLPETPAVQVSVPGVRHRRDQPGLTARQLVLPDDDVTTVGGLPVTTPARGYAKLYMDHVLQAEHGCDFDFLRKA